MSSALLADITIFVLSLLVGFEVISKVPSMLHTPLMSAANSIHGIVLVGAMLIAVTANNALGYVLAFIAASFAAANVVGGYVVTGRMLKMFRKRPELKDAGAAADSGAQGNGQVTADTSRQLGRSGTS
jgi:proton-translocating NAD(P)+ transhydrogenase subunit alpha